MKLKVIKQQLYKHKSIDIEGTMFATINNTRFILLKLTKPYPNSIMISDTSPFGYIITVKDELIKI